MTTFSFNFRTLTAIAVLTLGFCASSQAMMADEDDTPRAARPACHVECRIDLTMANDGIRHHQTCPNHPLASLRSLLVKPGMVISAIIPG